MGNEAIGFALAIVQAAPFFATAFLRFFAIGRINAGIAPVVARSTGYRRAHTAVQ